MDRYVCSSSILPSISEDDIRPSRVILVHLSLTHMRQMDGTHEEKVSHIVNFVLDDDPAGAENMRMIVVHVWYGTHLVEIC